MGARFSYNSGRSRRRDSARTEPSDDTVYVEDIEVDDDVPSDAGRRSRPDDEVPAGDGFDAGVTDEGEDPDYFACGVDPQDYDSTSDAMMEVREPIMRWWHGFQQHGVGRFIMEHTSIIRSAAEPDNERGLMVLWAPMLVVLLPLTILPLLLRGAWGAVVAVPAGLARGVGRFHAAAVWRAWQYDPPTVAHAYGPRQLVKRAPRFLPRTAARRKGKKLPLLPWDAGVLMGRSHGVEVWSTVEQPLYTVAPARMGKTRNFVLPLVLGAPGPVITTSTRRDVVDQTRAMRESGWVGPDGSRHRGGRCWVFDPMAVARGNPKHTLNWSPIDGCEDPHIARQRAADLMGTTGLSGDNETWKNVGGLIVQALLHAAALKPGGSLEDVYQWSRSFSAAQQAARILESAATDPAYKGLRDKGLIATDWNMELEELKVDDPRMKGNKWFSVSQAFAALTEPNVRRALSVAHDDPDRFKIADFLRSHDTIYMLCPFRNADGEGPAGIGTFVSMFLTAVVEEARRQAASSVGMGKLEPPVALILDEIANIDQWGMLPQVVTAGSGDGIWCTSIYQSRSQARARYGDDTEREMWDSSQKWMLGGVSNTADLREVSDLLGTRQIRRQEISHQGMKIEYGHVMERIEDKPVLSVDEARRIPEDMGLYLSGRNRAAVVNLIPPERRGWKPLGKRKDH